MAIRHWMTGLRIGCVTTLVALGGACSSSGGNAAGSNGDNARSTPVRASPRWGRRRVNPCPSEARAAPAARGEMAARRKRVRSTAHVPPVRGATSRPAHAARRAGMISSAATARDANRRADTAFRSLDAIPRGRTAASTGSALATASANHSSGRGAVPISSARSRSTATPASGPANRGWRPADAAARTSRPASGRPTFACLSVPRGFRPAFGAASANRRAMHSGRGTPVGRSRPGRWLACRTPANAGWTPPVSATSTVPASRSAETPGVVRMVAPVTQSAPTETSASVVDVSRPAATPHRARPLRSARPMAAVVCPAAAQRVPTAPSERRTVTFQPTSARRGASAMPIAFRPRMSVSMAAAVSEVALETTSVRSSRSATWRPEPVNRRGGAIVSPDAIRWSKAPVERATPASASRTETEMTSASFVSKRAARRRTSARKGISAWISLRSRPVPSPRRTRHPSRCSCAFGVVIRSPFNDRRTLPRP